MDSLLVNICDATPCVVVAIATFVNSNTPPVTATTITGTITDPFRRYYHSTAPGLLTEGTPKSYYYGPDGETYCAYDSAPNQQQYHANDQVPRTLRSVSRSLEWKEKEEFGHYDANTIIQDHQTLLYEEDDDDEARYDDYFERLVTTKK